MFARIIFDPNLKFVKKNKKKIKDLLSLKHGLLKNIFKDDLKCVFQRRVLKREFLEKRQEQTGPITWNFKEGVFKDKADPNLDF